jgi:hypothetical protein
VPQIRISAPVKEELEEIQHTLEGALDRQVTITEVAEMLLRNYRRAAELESP